MVYTLIDQLALDQWARKNSEEPYLIFAWTVSESNRLIGHGTVGPAASVFDGPGNCVVALLFP